MEFITQLPTSPFGWITLAIVDISAVIYLVSRVRANDMKVLREANSDLRAAHDDNAKELSLMRTEINLLTTKVKVLEHANKTLEELVVVALKQFFHENPTLANGLHTDIISK